MDSLSIKICAFAILCAVLSTVIKHINPSFSPFIRIAACVTVAVLALTAIRPIVTYINNLMTSSALGEYGGILIKAVGMGFVVQICGDICRDCGEGSIASGVELMGKIEILLLCLPLLQKIIETVEGVMAWG